MATNQEKLDYLAGTLQPGIANVQNAGELYARIVDTQTNATAANAGIETLAAAVAANKAALDALAAKPAASVTLTPDDIAAIAAQVAGQIKLPESVTADAVADAVLAKLREAVKEGASKL